MSLTAGTRLGPYEILSLLGRGGMGEVYKARDTRLDRTVAVKVLSDSLAADPNFRERFHREARAISQLAHQNICTLHDVGEQDGTAFLVMEYLVGETLADRLTKGVLPLDEALKMAIQIADALAAAHRRGIVHRDLKPGNVILTKAGAKLLDFGLAKASTSIAGGGLSMLPTTPPNLTAQGAILGTFQYMAPEQLEGQEAGARTDIFAFGAVLFEMLTGRKAFEGKSQASLIGAILHTMPPSLSLLQPIAPPSLDRIVTTCLAKDPDNRFQTAHDLSLQLQWIGEGGSTAGLGVPIVPRRRLRERAIWLTTLVVVGLVAATAAWWIKPSRGSPPGVTRFSYRLPPDQDFTRTGRREVAISPDGSKLAYIANFQIYVRQLDQLEARPVPGTAREDPLDLMFSPDGQWIAYFSPVGAKYVLKKIAVSGGSPLKLCEVGAPSGANWRKGIIVFAQNDEHVRGVESVSADGGTPRTVLTVGKTDLVANPDVLDRDGRLIFTLRSAAAKTWDEADIVLQAADRRTQEVVVHGGKDGRVLTDGHLTYVANGTLFAAAFDARRPTSRSEAVPVLEGVTLSLAGAQFAISDNGSIVFVLGAAKADRRLVWVDRQGHEDPIPAKPGQYIHPRLSPDANTIVVAAEDGERDLWTWDVPRGTLTQLTFGPDAELFPVWTPDGRNVIYQSTSADGARKIFRTRADGTGEPEPLATDGGGPTSVTPDGSALVYRASPGVGVGMDTLLPLAGGAPRPLPLSRTASPQINTQFSSDGHWIAYESHESQSTAEIFVRPFPNVDAGRWQISTAGGENPIWSPDGREIFYEDETNKLIRVPVQTGATFRAGAPEPLFNLNPYQAIGTLGMAYDISRDGKRFLMVKNGPQGVGSTLVVVTNWFEELKARVPTK